MNKHAEVRTIHALTSDLSQAQRAFHAADLLVGEVKRKQRECARIALLDPDEFNRNAAAAAEKELAAAVANRDSMKNELRLKSQAVRVFKVNTKVLNGKGQLVRR